MVDPEVVARLLAAIDEREREYNRCAEELREAARAKVRLPHTEFLRATVGDGLRLCQAHRDIVARFQRAWDRRNTGTPDEVAFRQTYVIAMIDVLADLAKGYGVEPSEPQPETMVFTGTPSNFDEVCRFLGRQNHGHREEGYGPDAHLVLHTPEGEVRVSVGDALLRHEDGRIELARGYGVEDT